MKRVTFDTNTFSVLNRNDNRASEDLQRVGASIRSKISQGEIRGFISEASVFVECLGFAEKLSYLAVAGTPDARPSVDERGVSAIRELTGLGFGMLHAPLIAAERFVEMPWAEDERFTTKERQDRFAACYRKFLRHKNPLDELRTIGNRLLRDQPPVSRNRTWCTDTGLRSELRQKWAVALKRDWDNGDDNHKKSLRKQLGPIIREWCDILIVSSHYAYGNDILCTSDKGRRDGINSILHHSNRANLGDEGIVIASPEDLLNHT